MNGKTILAGASALALATAGAAPMMALAAPANDAVAAIEQTQSAATAAETSPSQVFGEFAFTQSAVTPVSELSGVFSKSAAVLCQSLPQYGCSECASSLMLRAPGSPELQATLHDLAEADNGVAITMACACASNAPGGGAVANAEAQGVLLKTLAAMMAA